MNEIMQFNVEQIKFKFPFFGILNCCSRFTILKKTPSRALFFHLISTGQEIQLQYIPFFSHMHAYFLGSSKREADWRALDVTSVVSSSACPINVNDRGSVHVNCAALPLRTQRPKGPGRQDTIKYAGLQQEDR